MENKYLKKFIKKFIKYIVLKNSKFLLINKDNLKNIKLLTNGKYDYIVLENILETTSDIYELLNLVFLKLKPGGKIIIIYRNFLQPFFRGLIGVKVKNVGVQQNWLSTNDINNFLKLTNFEQIIHQPLCLFLRNIPLFSDFMNKILVHIFPFNHIAPIHFIIGSKIKFQNKDVSTTILIPAKNEAGNIKPLIKGIPMVGTKCEIIFIIGPSNDETTGEVNRCIKKYSKKLPFTFKVLYQKKSLGKADAVRKGLTASSGEIIFILDADISVKPNELIKFYQALITHKGELINGSRLIYPLSGKAMQFLNILGNKFFSILFSWILGQNIKDTLCGTKALWKNDYLLIKENFSIFGKYDPFGDFDLLIGAGRINLKIIDLPVRYYERNYGATNIKRFRNAWELLKFSFLAIKYLKLRAPN